MKEISRRCSDVNCGAKLRDTIIDWEDELHEKEIDAAEKHCRMADVVLCLGTRLQITPACDLPLKSLHGGGKIIIVNLQVIRVSGHSIWDGVSINLVPKLASLIVAVLPFLEQNTFFLYPIDIVIILSPILTLSGFNPSRYFMNIYFSRWL